MSQNLPNIIYMHSHDTGRYVQPYGHAIPTPRIQRLAEEGVLFRQAFCAAPTCSASRASLLTGQYAHNNGMLGLAHRGFSLRDYRQHIVHTLKKVGYYSVLAGEQHISKEPEIIGYDRVYKIRPHTADAVAPVVCDVLRNVPQQPFFISIGFSETHREFLPPDSEQEANYSLPPAHLPDTPETRRDMAGFKASARALDRGIGLVLDTLDACGLSDNTLVICTTDHGIAFPEAKGTLTDRGTGVMLIMRGPGGFRGGQVCDGMVSQIDLFPTICDLLHIEPPSWLQGQSLLPLLRQQRSEIHEEIYAESTYHASYEPQRAIRTKRWKYIRRYGDRTRPIMPNCDDSSSKDLLLAYDWRERPVPPEQLYDLIFDPNEACNLVNDPQYEPVVQELRSRLERWMQATDDPLLYGRIEPPAGAELNDPDQLSPGEATYIV